MAATAALKASTPLSFAALGGAGPLGGRGGGGGRVAGAGAAATEEEKLRSAGTERWLGREYEE